MPQVAPSPLEQIMQHAKQCSCMSIPTEQEAAELYELAKLEDAFAMEKVAKLYHNMIPPSSKADKIAVGIIVDAYTKFIKPKVDADI